MLRFAIDLMRLFIQGLRAFGNCHAFTQWLESPCTAVAGRKPADIIVDGDMERVAEIIERIREARRGLR